MCVVFAGFSLFLFRSTESPVTVVSYHLQALLSFTGLAEFNATTQYEPRAGSEIVRIDPLRFLARCRTRRLNQV